MTSTLNRPETSNLSEANPVPSRTVAHKGNMLVNWLTSTESGWDRTGEAPPPALPPEIVDRARARYIDAYERLSQLCFDNWPGGQEEL